MNNDRMQQTELTDLIPEHYAGVDLNIDGYTLTPRQREIALLMATRSITGLTQQKIADHYGISSVMVWKETQAHGYKEFQQELIMKLYGNLFTETVVGMHQMLQDSTTPKALKVKLYGMVLQAHGKGGNGVVVNVDQTRKVTLEDLEREVIEMERELLGD
ncbi:hypothetical protein QFZ28_003957 [Neobacillus niacini]|uniref:helix-turn-helix transcriptional regulator n=1 Tax=Neobacillus niacini TaxID=86668 RepID=UPI00277F4EC8|nr:hypothetical protein [Neobacillus niacini]MDQ1003557.1 hypothetical protein [Neobacillus niacini]